VTVTATVSDVAGNASSADRVGLVDATVPQVTINDFVTDTNTVNQLAHSQAQILSGSVTGAAAGDLVTITINSVITPPWWMRRGTGALACRRRRAGTG
jgi:hypothetical protein